MLWVLKRTVSMRRGFFEHPKHMIKLMGKEIFTILRLYVFVYLNLCYCFYVPKFTKQTGLKKRLHVAYC